MTIDEAIKAFEARFDRVESISFYADDIVEMLGGGIKADGGVTPLWCSDEATAVRLWFEAARHYHETHAGTVLVWRVKPECTGHVFHYQSYASSPEGAMEPVTFYKTYSRFAIRSAAPDYLGAARAMAGA